MYWDPLHKHRVLARNAYNGVTESPIDATTSYFYESFSTRFFIEGLIHLYCNGKQ